MRRVQSVSHGPVGGASLTGDAERSSRFPEVSVKRIHVAEPQLLGNELRYVTDCVTSRELTQGRYVADFEQRFAEFCGVRFAVACMNGTVALHLALLALDLQPGDEVLMPTLTYVATANAVRYCGATPVLCDVEPGTWCVSAEQVMRKRSKRTKGILPVHLYGHPADMDALNSLAMHFGWWVLEDAAEAHGATFKGRPVGALGTAATFSFYGNKIITCGEGGMVTTNDARLVERMRLFRGQGMSPSKRYFHPVVGYNYRMTNLQAALGLAQLEHVQEQLQLRRELVHQYRWWFNDMDTGVEVQSVRPIVSHSNWMFTILVPHGRDRDEIMQRLEAQQIETRPAFINMHQLPMYASRDAFPVADDVSRRGINLPTHTGMTHADVQRVCVAVTETLLNP